MPTSGPARKPTTTAITTDGDYKPVKHSDEQFVTGSVGSLSITTSTASVVIHGIVEGTVVVPYNCEKEDRRNANRVANLSSSSFPATAATIETQSKIGNLP